MESKQQGTCAVLKTFLYNLKQLLCASAYTHIKALYTTTGVCKVGLIKIWWLKYCFSV